MGSRDTIRASFEEAAKTLQQWGSSGNADGYRKAILGDRPGSNGKNLIWGWGRIAKAVSGKDKYRDTFHEARYNIAMSRYKFALSQSGAKKTELLKRAKADIIATKRLASLGGKRQEQRYESLLKAIQKSLGEKATGFSESE